MENSAKGLSHLSYINHCPHVWSNAPSICFSEPIPELNKQCLLNETEFRDTVSHWLSSNVLSFVENKVKEHNFVCK